MKCVRLILGAVLLPACFSLSGCAWSLRGISPTEQPSPSQLMALYDNTRLGESTSGEVLTSVIYPGKEYVTLDRQAVGIVGPRELADRTWLTVVGFGEESLAASSKYFFLINDRPRAFFYTSPVTGLFNAEQLISPDVLNETYTDDSARKIAILRDVRATFNLAVQDIKDDEARIRSCSMAVNQLMTALLAHLDASPVHAVYMTDPSGMIFAHPTLGKGRIRMHVDGNTVRLKVIVGPASAKYKDNPELWDM